MSEHPPTTAELVRRLLAAAPDQDAATLTRLIEQRDVIGIAERCSLPRQAFEHHPSFAAWIVATLDELGIPQ